MRNLETAKKAHEMRNPETAKKAQEMRNPETAKKAHETRNLETAKKTHAMRNPLSDLIGDFDIPRRDLSFPHVKSRLGTSSTSNKD